MAQHILSKIPGGQVQLSIHQQIEQTEWMTTQPRIPDQLGEEVFIDFEQQQGEDHSLWYITNK